VRQDVAVLLADLVAVSETVTATSARGGKIAALAEALRGASAEEAAVAVAFLSGELRQRQIGLGWAALRELPVAAEVASLRVGEVDVAFAAIGALGGPGSRDARRLALRELFGRATAGEQRFLRALLAGDLRQGALEGVMVEAAARAARQTRARCCSRSGATSRSASRPRSACGGSQSSSPWSRRSASRSTPS